MKVPSSALPTWWRVDSADERGDNADTPSPRVVRTALACRGGQTAWRSGLCHARGDPKIREWGDRCWGRPPELLGFSPILPQQNPNIPVIHPNFARRPVTSRDEQTSAEPHFPLLFRLRAPPPARTSNPTPAPTSLIAYRPVPPPSALLPAPQPAHQPPPSLPERPSGEPPSRGP